MVTNHVYTIAGAKGGVGKTTSSINLGTLLAEAGYSTVVVEMDLAMANLVDFLDVDIDTDEDPTFHDVLAGEASVTDAMYETDVGLSIVPSGTTLEGYADTDLDLLPDIVKTLRWHHDVVLLDTPAGLSEETIRPLQLADDVLLISTPRVASIRNVSNTKELAERVDAPVRGLVLTKSGTGASPGADEIAEFLDVELLGHVPEDDAVPHSQDNGTPAVQNAPRSGAAIAYKRISRQLVDTEKASVDSTAVATHSVPDDAVPTYRQVEQPAPDAEPAEAGTTDGGLEVHPPGTVADDSDLIGPVPPEQDGVDDRDDDAEPTDADESPVSEEQTAATEDETETGSVIDGEALVDTEPAPLDGAEESGDEPEPATGTPQSVSEDLQDASESESDTDDRQDVDESESDTDDLQDADELQSETGDPQNVDESEFDTDDLQDADESESDTDDRQDADESESDTDDRQDADESESDTDDRQDADESESDTDDRQEADESESDTDDRQEADGSESDTDPTADSPSDSPGDSDSDATSDGLGARMRSLFGL
ncbi:P-loop NTPase [Haloarcula sp. 1CSR25-25]|uniref:P-loop NTPase n=1 Tax=Haloarcula sp. 1CSR25-25 TaxID=2862545 RepID=UPI002894D5BD|nr:P-loop NTPase [Haloarcula sp. 1CSR25-25]MDT3436153.1 P-loop NTPase [Haloarcula sp. 1CSR25-25]